MALQLYRELTSCLPLAFCCFRSGCPAWKRSRQRTHRLLQSRLRKKRPSGPRVWAALEPPVAGTAVLVFFRAGLFVFMAVSRVCDLPPSVPEPEPESGSESDSVSDLSGRFFEPGVFLAENVLAGPLSSSESDFVSDSVSDTDGCLVEPGVFRAKNFLAAPR